MRGQEPSPALPDPPAPAADLASLQQSNAERAEQEAEALALKWGPGRPRKLALGLTGDNA